MERLDIVVQNPSHYSRNLDAERMPEISVPVLDHPLLHLKGNNLQ